MCETLFFTKISRLVHRLLPSGSYRCIALTISISLSVLFPEPTSLAAESPFTYQNPSEGINQLRIQDDTLTVDLRDALIGKVLEQISRQGNIRIVSEAPIERHITILFNGLQIDQGLKKILRGQDIIFLYSKREEGATSHERYYLKEVRLIGQKPEKEGDRTVSTASAAKPRTEPAPRKPPPSRISMDRRERPLPPPPRTPPAPPIKSPEQADKAPSGITDGNADALQDMVKRLEQDNPQLQQQIDQFVESLGQMNEQAEREGTPPPLDHMGAIGPLMNQMLKDQSLAPPPDIQEQIEKQLMPSP